MCPMKQVGSLLLTYHDLVHFARKMNNPTATFFCKEFGFILSSAIFMLKHESKNTRMWAIGKEPSIFQMKIFLILP